MQRRIFLTQTAAAAAAVAAPGVAHATWTKNQPSAVVQWNRLIGVCVSINLTPVTIAALRTSADGVLTTPEISPLPEVSFSAPGRNSYDYRLVVSRKLYDRAVSTQMSRSLVNLAPGSAVYVNPLDLDTIGVAVGDDVKVVSAKAASVLPIAADLRIPRGVVWSPFNQASGTIEDIVDGAMATTDVRIERI